VAIVKPTLRSSALSSCDRKACSRRELLVDARPKLLADVVFIDRKWLEWSASNTSTVGSPSTVITACQATFVAPNSIVDGEL
jgi:hypothetical protein